MTYQAWTITDSETSVSVSFSPASGDLIQRVDQPVGVLYPLRGASPKVTTGVARLAELATPEWLLVGNAGWATMKAILTSGHRLELTDDTGTVYPCRTVGGYTVTIEDTPNRATFPRRRIAVKLIGVE